jgi:zinc transporter ZupT
MDVGAATVAAAALATALATGLGVLPFAFTRSVSPRTLALASASAAGFMLAASAGLVAEGADYGPGRVLAGAAAGGLFVAAARRVLLGRDVHVGSLVGADAVKAIGIVAVMTVHSVAEGVGVGVSYGGGAALGVFITVAIAVHNVPEGLAIGTVLVPRGVSVGRAAWWAVFSSLPQPLLAVPAFLFVEAFLGVLPVGLGFAGGAMVWLVLAELVPDARAGAADGAVAAVAITSFGAMLALQLVLG